MEVVCSEQGRDGHLGLQRAQRDLGLCFCHREDARFIFENKQQVHRLTEEVRRVSVQCYRLRQKNKTLERILRRMVDLLRGSSPADLAAARVEAERIQRTI